MRKKKDGKEWKLNKDRDKKSNGNRDGEEKNGTKVETIITTARSSRTKRREEWDN